MMKIVIAIFCSLSFSIVAAQDKSLYHPEANAEKDIAEAVKKAASENKYVLIQGGGNWCGWCIEFARLAQADYTIDSLIKKDFVWYHLNYSKENMNKAVFEKLGFPQRFGFPVFIILNGKGERMHTQNSEYLEDGKKSYDIRKVFEFLSAWRPAAFDPNQYNQ